MTERHRQFLKRVWASVRHTPTARRDQDVEHLVGSCAALLSQRGEVSMARIAADASAEYGRLNEEGREEFFYALATDYSPNAADLQRAIDAYQIDPSPLHAHALHQAA